MTISDNKTTKKTLIFSYGTLKHGFSNHTLIQELISQNHAVFLGTYITDHPLPLVRGPYGVPFLLNLPGKKSCHRVHGELYSVTEYALQRLDFLEGVTLGHYERLPITVRPETCDGSNNININKNGGGDNININGDNGNGGGGWVVEGEAYYGHRSFAEDMWRRCGEVGFEAYSHEVAKGYVRRDLRPKDRSFREQIALFCSSS